MKNGLYEQIVFCKETYNDNADELFNVVAKQLRLLLDAGYIAVVRYDEPSFGIVVIEYEHDEHEEAWGCANPIWCTAEEEDIVLNSREKSEGEDNE